AQIVCAVCAGCSRVSTRPGDRVTQAAPPPVSGALAAASPSLRSAAHRSAIAALTAPVVAFRRVPFQQVLWPLLAALLSFAAWQPFVRPDFDVWQADDGEYHLLRVYVFGAAVKAGEWLPRWTPDLFVGFGYPIFNFYAPGTYYAAM